MKATNNGVVTLNDTFLIDKINADLSFVSASIPTNLNATIYYNVDGAGNDPDDIPDFDENTGVLILDNTSDVNFPIIYATKDGGKNWQEVKFSYFNFPDEIQYIVDIDSITKENEDYIITLGQGEKGTLKAVFYTRDLFSPWLFNKTLKKNIHTVG